MPAEPAKCDGTTPSVACASEILSCAAATALQSALICAHRQLTSFVAPVAKKARCAATESTASAASVRSPPLQAAAAFSIAFTHSSRSSDVVATRKKVRAAVETESEYSFFVSVSAALTELQSRRLSSSVGVVYTRSSPKL
eukprot:2895816-Prymnesium_polylepis.2